MPGVKELNESDVEEMDQESGDSDKSSDEDTDSTSGSGSQGDDSSEIDEEDCDRRRNECLIQMSELEKQFVHMKEQLYEERKAQIDIQLEEVKLGIAPDWVQPLADLLKNKEQRFEVSDTLRNLRIANVKNIQEAEAQAIKQNFESEKSLAYDSIKGDLEDRIRRLEEDRNSVDITSDLWNEQVNNRKNKRKPDVQCIGKRRKPVTVTGPYIIYQLPENDILEDWTTIRKALKATKQSSEYEFNTTDQRVSARFTDGKLLFKGDSFRKGEAVLVEDKTDRPWPAVVLAVNTSEVLLQKHDGGWSKVGISDLQSGKFNIRHDD